MLQPFAQQPTTHTDSPTHGGAVCEMRTNLLDRLADVLANLGHAKLELTAAAEDGDGILYESARTEVGRLRSESTSIRYELEHHRAQHGC